MNKRLANLRSAYKKVSKKTKEEALARALEETAARQRQHELEKQNVLKHYINVVELNGYPKASNIKHVC